MREERRYVPIRRMDQLEQLAPEWMSLWETDPQATPFQNPAWLIPWWHSFGEDLRAVGMFPTSTGIISTALPMSGLTITGSAIVQLSTPRPDWQCPESFSVLFPDLSSLTTDH